MQDAAPRALVVEDDAALRMLSRVTLELEGFVVDEAAAATAARAQVESCTPGVVVLDLTLADGDARPLLSWLRQRGVPVVLVTGAAELGEAAGLASAILEKPFEPAELVRVARRLAGRRG